METKIYSVFLVCIALCCNQIFSQPVLSQADIMPVQGDSFVYIRQNNMAPITNAQGPNVAWNFTYNPVVVNTHYYIYKNPAATPFNTLFPGAYICEVSYPSSPTYIRHSYQYLNSGILEEGGEVSPAPADTIAAFLGDYVKLKEFPIQYPDSVWDFFKGTSLEPDNDTVPRHGARYYIADSYGTLVYSTGDTITDVLRVFTHYHYIDSMPLSYDSTFLLTTAWYKAGVKAPLIYQRLVGFWQYIYSPPSINSGVSQSHYYLDIGFLNNIISGNQHPESRKEFELYPNPAINELRIMNAGIGIEHVEIYDVLGIRCQLINVSGQSSLAQQLSTGNYPLTVDVSKLKAGMYCIKLKTEAGITTGKFVKQ